MITKENSNLEESKINECQRHRAKWRHYWELLWFKTYTDLKIETQITYLGFLWWFLEPVFFLFIYYYIFAIILKTRTPHFIEFLFVGVVAWRWFAPAMSRSCRSIKSQARLMREIYISKLIFPASVVLNDAFKFVIIFSILLIFLAAFHNKPTVLWFTVVPNFICQLTIIFGYSFCFAAVTPFIPDFPLVIQTFTFALMMISGIFFDVLAAPPHLAYILQFNPIADVLINYRLPLINHQSPQWGYMLYTFAFGCVLNVIGIYVIRKNERIFPKVCA